MTKPIGSPKSRRTVKAATKRALKAVKRLTPTDAALVLGVSVNDVRNMRQGNNLSIPILLKMVRKGGYTPSSILFGPDLEMFNGTKSRRGAQQRLVNGRIRKLARQRPGKEIAKLTGLSVTGAYGLRYNAGANVTLYTIMGFHHAGHDIDSMIFGG